MAGPIIISDGYDENPNFVDFGRIARGDLGQQCQYASRYINGNHGYPCLGYGLRFIGNDSNYHSWQIHKDDVEEFVRRVLEHREN